MPTNRPIAYIDSKEFNLSSVCNSEAIYTLYENIPNINVGLYIYGPAGTGKTTIAHSFAQKWIQHHEGDMRIKVHAYDWYEICEAMKAITHKTQKQISMLYNIREGFKSEHCLTIIDDFAGGRVTEFIADEWSEIIREADKKGGRVIFTSNVNPKGIKESFGEQILSRIAGMTMFVETTGKDRRGNG